MALESNMNLLLIDTSQKEALVVVSDQNRVTSFVYENVESSCSQKIIFLIDEALKQAGVHKNDIGALGCVVGPGSFTGIRIGIATVSALAYSKKRSVIPICSLEYRVFHLIKEGKSVLSVLPSHKNEAYACLYPGGVPYVLDKYDIQSVETISASVLAQNLADCAWMFFNAHKTVEYFNIQPLYVRKAYAEPSS